MSNMTPKQYRLVRKNMAQWSAFIDKLEARDSDKDHPRGPLTDDEKEDLNRRKAQMVVWAHDLKHASPGGMDDEGDMSADAGVATESSASVSDG